MINSTIMLIEYIYDHLNKRKPMTTLQKINLLCCPHLYGYQSFYPLLLINHPTQ